MSTDPVTDRPPRERAPPDDRSDRTPPQSGLEPGTSVLVAGPALVGADEFVLESLARATDRGERAVAIATGDDHRSVRTSCRRRSEGFSPERLGVVDCVSETDDRTADDPRVRTAASPADLTGIGIAASDLLSNLGAADGVLVGLDSLSTLILYSEFERVCRFLHVLSGRVARANATGLFGLAPGSVEAGEYEQLKTLFDGVLELRRGDDGREVRARGLAGVDSGWRPCPSRNR